MYFLWNDHKSSSVCTILYWSLEATQNSKRETQNLEAQSWMKYGPLWNRTFWIYLLFLVHTRSSQTWIITLCLFDDAHVVYRNNIAFITGNQKRLFTCCCDFRMELLTSVFATLLIEGMSRTMSDSPNRKPAIWCSGSLNERDLCAAAVSRAPDVHADT